MFENRTSITLDVKSGAYHENDLISNPHTLSLLQDAANAGMLVAGTCTGVRVLAAAGVLNGKNATGNPKYSNEYTAAGANFVGAKHYPVIDGNIVTTTAGDFFNIQNCNAMAKVIDGIKKTNPGISDSEEFSTSEQQLANGVLQKTYGGIYSDGGRAVCQTNDGGFAIAGYTFSRGEGNADILFIKLDYNGNLIWLKTLGGTGNEYANSIAQCSDGNFIIAGYTTSYGSGEEDVIVVKTDADGNEMWLKYFGGAASDQANKVIVTSNGDYLVAGFTDSFCSSGNGSYIIVGDADITNQDLYQVYSIKTNGGQSTQWDQRTGRGTNYDYGITVSKLDDNNYIVLGNTKANSSGNDVYMLHLNESGAVLKREVIGDTRSDWGAQGIITNDRNYYIVPGHTNSSGAGLFDVLFLKIPISAITDVEEENVPKTNFSLMQNYPNPFNPGTVISFDLPEANFVAIKLYDLLGNEISTIINEYKPAGNYKINFDGSNLASGIYLCTMQAGSFIQTNKLILIK